MPADNAPIRPFLRRGAAVLAAALLAVFVLAPADVPVYATARVTGPSTAPAAPITVPVTAPGSASAPAPRIVINIPAFTAVVYHGETAVAWIPVAVGMPGTPTPRGEYHIVSRVPNPSWLPPRGGPVVPPGPGNPLGAYWFGLSIRGYGLHGTNAPSSIGKTVSLGCVRMHNENAAWLHGMVKVGTPVEIVYRRVEVVPGHRGPVALIHPDPYGLDRPTPAQLAQRLVDLGVPAPPDEDTCRELLNAAAAGRSVVWPPDIDVWGVRIAGLVQVVAGRPVVSLALLARTLAEAGLPPAVPVLAPQADETGAGRDGAHPAGPSGGGDGLVPLAELDARLGLDPQRPDARAEIAPGWVNVFVGEDWAAFGRLDDDGRVWVPAMLLAAALGRRATVSPVHGICFFHWPELCTAVAVPYASLAGEAVFVPLDAVCRGFGYRVEWPSDVTAVVGGVR